MKLDKNINIFVQLPLRIITFFQQAALKQQNDLYYSLTKLHFKLYFGKSLVEEAVNNSREFRAAQKRHVAMVMINVYRVNKGKETMAKAISSAFQKNLLLEATV